MSHSDFTDIALGEPFDPCPWKPEDLNPLACNPGPTAAALNRAFLGVADGERVPTANFADEDLSRTVRQVEPGDDLVR